MYELYGKQSHNTYFTNKPAFTTTKVLILQVIDYNSFVLKQLLRIHFITKRNKGKCYYKITPTSHTKLNIIDYTCLRL